MSPSRPSEQFHYGDHERQRLTCYDHAPNSEKIPLIFIHGGAWKDPRNTDNDSGELFGFLPDDIPLFSIDYRLTPEVKYPKHNNDVLSAIRFILGAHPYEKIKLAGHSAGATIILSILGELGDVVDEVFLLDGIFDLSELVDEYPSYREFVSEAHDNYQSINALNLQIYKSDIKFSIIHSYQDELLSLRQTKWLIKQLEESQRAYTLTVGNFGEHEEVYRNKKVADIINATY